MEKVESRTNFLLVEIGGRILAYWPYWRISDSPPQVKSDRFS